MNERQFEKEENMLLWIREREEERENVRESFNMIVAAPIPESVCNRERQRCVVTRMTFK